MSEYQIFNYKFITQEYPNISDWGEGMPWITPTEAAVNVLYEQWGSVDKTTAETNLKYDDEAQHSYWKNICIEEIVVQKYPTEHLHKAGTRNTTTSGVSCYLWHFSEHW